MTRGPGLTGIGRIAARSVALLICFVLSSGAALAERLAMVVGNAAYDVATDLANPVGDATAIADALRRLDFKVTLLTDAGGDTLWTEMDRFATEAETADSVVFYYAGHAFQMSGVNYLVPVTAKLADRDTLKGETWSLDAIIARLQSRNRQTLIFLDACRNDPLPASVRGSGAASDGLARVQTGVGTFVAFATEPGGVTADGVDGAAHSPFATALLKHIETEGISVSDMMIEVRNDVETATLRRQVPWDQSSLRSQFYFVPPTSAGKQELSEADYELLAQLSPEDRKAFLDLLSQSGFDADSLATAEASIAVAEANLEIVATQTTIIIAPVAEEVVAASPEPELSLDDIVVSDAATTTVSDAPSAVISAIDPSLDPAADDADGTIRLAALQWDTRDIGLNEVTIQRMRLVGRVLEADSDTDRDILAAIDPRLIEEGVPLDAPSEGDLAKFVQSELQRLGCYQMTVDGDWGKGSRTALTSYYLAKKIVPTSLEPTLALYSGLLEERNVVCKVRVANSAVKTGNRTAPTALAATPAVEGIKGRKEGSKKPVETKKKKIEKATIGMTGSF